jgi:hypothetical protein
MTLIPVSSRNGRAVWQLWRLRGLDGKAGAQLDAGRLASTDRSASGSTEIGPGALGSTGPTGARRV